MRTRAVRPAFVGYFLSGAAGAAGWLHLAHWRWGREGWDNPGYFSAFLPLLIALAFCLGAIAPERPWRWALTMFGAQALVAFLGNPTASLLPLGLILFGAMAVPAVGAAYVGALARRAVTGRT